MRNFLLLLLIILFSCGKDSYQPLAEKEEIYYIVIRPDQANPEQDYEEIFQIVRSHSDLRLSRLFTGKQNEVLLFVIRKFTQLSEGERVTKKIEKRVDLPPGEVKLMTQFKFRNLLKYKSFDTVGN